MGVSRQTILNWIAAGRLPAQQTPGGRYRIDVSDTVLRPATPRTLTRHSDHKPVAS